MDNQDQGKHHSSGHESHGVHLCSKCGWPFPNPHPSAKHRRAHKNNCGKIEGYKIGDSTHSSASDDEPHSEDEHKTTIAQEPQVMESRNPEKSISGIGAMSNRSEDEVFSDAKTEFLDSGSGLGRQDSSDSVSKADKFFDKDLTATISFKDCEDDTDAIQSPRGLADSSQKEVPVVESMNNGSDDKNDSADDLIHLKPQTQTGVLEESSKVNVDDSIEESSIEQGTDASGNDEGKLNKKLVDDLVLPSEGAGELSESVPKSDNIVQLKEELSAGLDSKISLSEHSEHDTDGKAGPGINLERNLMDVVASESEYPSVTFERREDITSESELDGKLVKAEGNTDKLAVNMVLHNLSPEAESIKHTDVSAVTPEMKIDAVQVTDSVTPINSSDVHDKKEIENESVYVLPVPDDIPVIKDAESKFEGFKDNQGLKLPQFDILASEAVVTHKEDDVKDNVFEKLAAYHSNKIDDDIKEDTSHKNVAEDNETVVKEVLVEGKADVLHIDKGSAFDGDTTENEKDRIVSSLEEQQPVNVSDDLHQVGFSGSLTNVAADNTPVVAPAKAEAEKSNNVVGIDDVGTITESARTEELGGENHAKNAEVSHESTDSSTVSQANSRSNNSVDIGSRKARKDDINVVESGERPEGYISVKMDSRSESISTHQHSSVVTEEVNTEFVRILPETEGPHLSKVSTSQYEINSGNKVQGEYTGEDAIPSALDHREGNDSKSSSDDQLKKTHLPPDAEPTSQSATDSHATDPGVDASGISTVNWQREADNFSVKNQQDATLLDASVESSSQTDSLDAHWGSVSVLSTQSDNQAVVDAETLPPTGSRAAEKANLKKSTDASEAQDLDKSDEFEPPSFMTLVEPGAGGQKTAAAASEIQTEQNAQQQQPIASHMQAGWFPSLTHVANESEGRKKNEEIIVKVTNWNAKQHTPLKNLLGEGEQETKPKSPNSKEGPTVVIPREENTAKDNGAPVTKVSSILGPETPVAQPTNMEAGKEWNSPARYRADIKREKRKVKGRPLWQFVCCSSVN